ncbi:hypothetical protein GCM10007907_17380 [Chitinimonas prasina]|uniref:Response regulatory domain-containing protein n=1 Tax=Chitinimonas prasina TaxID=1434937 RepID=A0ABQ5YG25_9NEIS|nr:response regulator [Chitinimonas prasina]GLR12948.1 hypothetical protein GCM10007907_17380 [Chitinimonas prasina]
MQATKILIVDDDPLQLRRMAGILGAHYAIDTLDRGAGFKEALARYAPDLVILDIELPDVNGIALCRELKAHSETAATPVVFHSSHDTLDERMEAYEAGGEDFLLKSMGADELLAKVGIMLEWISRNRLLAKEEQAARAAADAVKHDLSEIGIALEALRQMGVSDDMQSLARVGVDALSDWRIDANVQVRVGKDKYTLNPRGHATPLETSIIHNSRLSGPVFQFRDHLALNFDHASILVRNLPQGDAVKLQRVRDLCSVLGEGLDARARALEVAASLQERNMVLTSFAAQAEKALLQLQGEWRERQGAVAAALQALKDELEQDFLRLALSKDEEKRCLVTLGRGMTEVTQVSARELAADMTLRTLREKLAHYGRQR